jgi:hypothetical protein
MTRDTFKRKYAPLILLLKKNAFTDVYVAQQTGWCVSTVSKVKKILKQRGELREPWEVKKVVEKKARFQDDSESIWARKFRYLR